MSIFHNPGHCDVTADVDFSMVAKSGLKKGVFVSKVVPQGHFLLGMGADKRLEALITPDSVTDEDAEKLVNGLEYLVSAKYMGQRFKVIAFSSVSSDIVGFPPSPQ